MMGTIVAILFSLAGLGLIWLGILSIRKVLVRTRHWKRASGVIVGEEHIQSYRTEGSYTFIYPKVRFQPEGEVPVEFVGSHGSMAPCRIGKKVRVLYDPADPGKAMVQSLTNFVPAVILLFFGIGFAGIFLAALFLSPH